MLKNNASSFNKKALLAEKEKILQELQYYEKRIQDFPNNSSSDYFNVNNSSDSEDDYPTTLEPCQPMPELKHQARLLKICLLATQELTGVGLLQSEINVMVEDPILDGEKPVSEPGLWREVTAECRIDMVPFSISFFTHQPSRKFAQLSYRGLRVLPVKTTHEIELSKSVLTGLCHPSDAIEVLRSYSVAYRSRRTTMARLAEKYANSLFMEPLPEGGFMLKCANLLEMSWRLDNKISTIAPFHHKMNFDLEHIDEYYLKIIKQAHRQLSNPSLETDERTRLLAKIISTCLEAQGPTQELYESMESDTESIRKLEKTTLTDDESTTRDRDDDKPEPKRKRDDEVMAPPKTIPKKAQPKGKENMNENRKTMKRTGGQVVSTSGKKARTDGTDENVRNSVKDIENTRNSKPDAVRQVVKEAKNGVSDKNKVKTVAKQKNIEKVVEKDQNVEKDSDKTQKQIKLTKKVIDKPKSSENIEKNKVTEEVGDNNTNAGISKNIDKTTKEVNMKNSKDKEPTKKLTQKDKTGQVKSIEIDKNTDAIIDNNDKTEQNKPKSSDPKVVKKVKETEKNGSQNTKITKTKIDEAVNKNENKNTKTNEINNVDKNIQKAIGTKNKAKAKINEESTACSKATTENTENEYQMSENIEKVKNVNSKNAKNNKTKIKPVKPITSANQETQINANANNNINSDPANAKKNVKSDPANAKKNVKSDTAKKSVNNPKDTTEKRSKASKVAPNEDLSEGNDINVLSNPKSATANKEGLGNDSDPMKTLSKNFAATKNTVNDAKNLASTKNTANDAKNLASTKNTVHNAKNLASTKNTVNDAKNLASTKNTANDAKNLASTKNTVHNAKNLASTKNTVNDAKTSIGNQDITKNKSKPKMVVKNHRNSVNKPHKKSTITTTLKPNISKESGKISKIPQKKLSPAYAAVLKQNPVRISPKMMSKFKSPSDPNVQSKIFKPVTNIPRLQKKPAPKSK